MGVSFFFRVASLLNQRGVFLLESGRSSLICAALSSRIWPLQLNGFFLSLRRAVTVHPGYHEEIVRHLFNVALRCRLLG